MVNCFLAKNWSWQNLELKVFEIIFSTRESSIDENVKYSIIQLYLSAKKHATEYSFLIVHTEVNTNVDVKVYKKLYQHCTLDLS